MSLGFVYYVLLVCICIFRLRPVAGSSLDTHLVSQWLGDGNTADVMGRNPGTWVGTARYSPDGGFYFDGTNGWTASVNGLPMGSADRTMMAWVKVEALNTAESTTKGEIIGYGTPGSYTQMSSMYLDESAGAFAFSQWGDGVAYGGTPTLDTWYHFAISIQSSIVSHYVNGVLSATPRSMSISTSPNHNLCVGGWYPDDAYGGNSNLKGYLKDIRIYDAAATQQDIANIYQQGAANVGQMVGDPEFTGFHGQRYQIHGFPNTYFNLISSPSLSLNSEFVYIHTGHCYYQETPCWTHPGTYISQVGLVMGSSVNASCVTGDCMMNTIHIVSGSHTSGLRVWLNGAEWVPSTYAMIVNSSSIFASSDGYIRAISHNVIHIHVHPFTFIFTNSDFFLNIAFQLHDHSILKAGSPSYTETQLFKYPNIPLHGLVGQTWRNVAYNHAHHPYEGDIDDYIVSSKFDTTFKFGQFQYATDHV